MSKVAYDIELFDDSWESQIKNGCERAGYYSNFYDMLLETILTIHGIPSLPLRPRVKHSDLEIYIGRSHRGNVVNRLKSSMDERGHRFGVIVGEVPTELIEDVESAVLRVLKILKRNNRLCVADIKNKTVTSFGSLPETPDSLIYITFGTEPEDNFYGETKSSSRIFQDIGEEASLLLERPQMRKLKDVLSYISKRSESRPIWWHNDHN